MKKGYSGTGVKKTNQDNFFIYNNFNNNSNYIYVGVYDAHGLFGQDISTYLINNLPKNMNHNVINKEIKNLCVLGKFNGYEWSSKALSRDHKPSEPDDMNRILKNEGKVE